MSWSDILFPENAKKRQDVVRGVQKIYSCLDRSFDATNELVKILNEHVLNDEHVSTILMKEDQTIRFNCENLVEKLEELQELISSHTKIMASKLDPEIYRKLQDPDTSFIQVIQTVKKTGSDLIHIAGGATAVVVLTLLGRSRHIVRATTVLRGVGKLAVASVTVAILTLAVEVIFSAILGAIEKKKLNKALEELNSVLEDFEPKSKEFSKTILKIAVTLENDMC